MFSRVNKSYFFALFSVAALAALFSFLCVMSAVESEPVASEYCLENLDLDEIEDWHCSLPQGKGWPERVVETGPLPGSFLPSIELARHVKSVLFARGPPRDGELL